MTRDPSNSTSRSRPTPEEPLSRRVIFRLSEAELVCLMEKVTSSGLTMSGFLRECVLTNRTKIVARLPASVDRKRILFVVNKAGNNLNQLAHVANTQQLAGKLSESTFLAILDQLELVEQLLKAHLHRVD
ncbi:plasmid mobilization protein [Paraburkholderia sp. GAS33]|uniref:plasmid mobilization protein n=1 Tax=Paraburkholderia sp. GAS33 TaxID=3035130 RepID=UPI003D1FAFA7